MKLCVPAVYEFEYIDLLEKLNKKSLNNKVTEIYGSFNLAEVSSLRPSIWLDDVKVEFLSKYVKYAKDKGIFFNYVMNATCIGNKEVTKEGALKIDSFIRSLVSLGIEYITVSIPYLIAMIHERFPEIKIVCSICNEVDSVEKAKRFKELGVERIVLSRDINRNMSLLNDICAKVEMEYEVLANSKCLLKCINNQAHGNSSSHASLIDDANTEKIQYNVYYFTYCQMKRVCNPENLLKSQWIRPEDMKYYDEKKINYLKIDGRGKSSNDLLEVIEAYMICKYDGNFLKIIDKTISDIFYLDNKKLSGFTEIFYEGKKSCNYDCDKCKVCLSYSLKNLEVDKKKWIKIKVQLDRQMKKLLKDEKSHLKIQSLIYHNK